jgi:hypothetical protein
MSVKNSDNYVWTNTSNLSCIKMWIYTSYIFII